MAVYKVMENVVVLRNNYHSFCRCISWSRQRIADFLKPMDSPRHGAQLGTVKPADLTVGSTAISLGARHTLSEIQKFGTKFVFRPLYLLNPSMNSRYSDDHGGPAIRGITGHCKNNSPKSGIDRYNSWRIVQYKRDSEIWYQNCLPTAISFEPLNEFPIFRWPRRARDPGHHWAL